jgi:hypothetical protein
MITQCRFSPRVEHFKEDFLHKWNLVDYSNLEEPCVFVGYYNQEDVTAIQKHNGYKILLPTGTVDLQKNQTYVNTLYQDKKVFFVKCWWASYPVSVKVKNIKIPMKDYSLFQPNELGDKVYCYLGVEGNKNEYGFKLAEEVKKKIPFEVIYGFRDQGKNLPIKKLKENFYDKCFVNLNFSLLKVGGFTSVNELGFMGRKSITTSNRRENFLINFKKEENISKIILKESKKIGTVQPNLMDNHFVGEEWLDMSYWFRK